MRREPGAVELLANRVLVHVHISGKDPARAATDRRYLISVDGSGHVEIERLGRNMTAEQIQDAIDELIDLDILQWAAVGPEDSELFLTEQAHALLARQLVPLRSGWTRWPEMAIP